MRAWLLWLLILALPVYGAAATQLRMLGPAHWHASVAAKAGPDHAVADLAPGWLLQFLDRVQHMREQAHLRAHALGHKASPHSHHGLQHHWHDRADGSVRHVVDPAVADLVAGAEVGSAMLALGAPPRRDLGLDTPANGRWPPAAPPRWADANRPPASPPPRS